VFLFCWEFSFPFFFLEGKSHSPLCEADEAFHKGISYALLYESTGGLFLPFFSKKDPFFEIFVVFFP